MKKYRYGLLAIIGFLLAGCDYNDKHFGELDDLTTPKDIKAVEYTLTEADYKAIAKYPANKDLVDSLDAEIIELIKKEGVIGSDGKIKVVGSDGTEYEAEEVGGIITFSVYQDALASVAKNLSFSPLLPVDELLVPFLKDKWAYKDPKTAVKLTYTKDLEISAFDNKLNLAQEITIESKDYESVWGDIEADYFTDEKPAKDYIPGILATKLVDSKEGDIVVVNYKYSILEPNSGSGQESPILFKETFPEGFTVEGSEWSEIILKGTRTWQWKIFDGVGYMQFSANKSKEENVNRLVTPSIRLKGSPTLTFDVKVGYYTGKPMKIYIAEDKDNLEWEDITSSFTFPDGPATGYGQFENAGVCDIKKYTNKRVYIAFEYNGNGKEDAENGVTTTIQLTNVVVTNTDVATTRSVVTRAQPIKLISNLANIYQLQDNKWTLNSNILVLNSDDYSEMGVSNEEFPKLADGIDKVIKLLTREYPFVADKYYKDVVFKVKQNPDYLISNFVRERFVYAANSWEYSPKTEQITAQFIRFEKNEWKFDPSIYLVLATGQSATESTKFYQPITDWVWENIDQKKLGLTAKGTGFVTSYGNNDYYFGTSAHQNNVDFRLVKYAAQYPKEFEGINYSTMSDAELAKFLKEERWPKAFKIGLEHAYPNVELIPGMDIIYTINFGVFDGTNYRYEIKFKLVNKGEFEYVENSIVQI